MSEIAIGNLIKIILGILVFVAVVLGMYFIFKDKIFTFFGSAEPAQLFRSII